MAELTPSGTYSCWAGGELALAFITTAKSVLKVPRGGATQHNTLQLARVERTGGMDSTAQTRSHMSFLMNSLQYYLMADELDTRMSGLCHDQFLTEVQASIFLHNRQVQKCLLDLMTNCLQFCSAEGDTSYCLTFTRQSQFLIQLLTSLRTHLAPSSLAQLLTRIDYNRFFSRRDRAAPAQ